MNSCLYECTVFHRRLAPRRHEFTYRIFLFLLDLGELDLVAREVPVFSIDDPNLYSLRREDYFRLAPGGIRESVAAFLADRGVEEPPARMRVLTLPRFLGYTFNPISVFFCETADGGALPAVVQVGNTFRELKPYLVPPAAGGFHQRTPKDFYVSPFSELDLEFDFRLATPGPTLRVNIDDYRGGEKVLVSSVSGRRLELTLANLLMLTVKYPLVTLKVIALIHWEALRLWAKRIPFRMKEDELEKQKGVYHTRPEPTVNPTRN